MASVADQALASGLVLDRLPEAVSSLDVGLLKDTQIPSDTPWGSRGPHRHDYHELIWTREGSGRHLIDGESSLVEPNTLTVIGRGQVHLFEHAVGVNGAVIRFGGELLYGDVTASANPSWLTGMRVAHRVAVPAEGVARLESIIATIADEVRRPPDSCSVDVQRHLLAVLLLWVERWFEATQLERRDADDPELGLYRAFVEVLERDFARHHEAAYYAEALRVPRGVLSRALAHVTGRTTKQLITDRRTLEAARLLRFTNMSVGEVAFRAGFSDHLYFSRAFKRATGEAPSAYRDRVRGRGLERVGADEGPSPALISAPSA
ncbi:MAG: AraC family transcriptional regulator [Solirubrobacteraceae bacterium]